MNYKLSDIIKAQNFVTEISLRKPTVDLLEELIRVIDVFKSLDLKKFRRAIISLKSRPLTEEKLSELRVVLDNIHSVLEQERKTVHQYMLKAVNNDENLNNWNNEEDYFNARSRWQNDLIIKATSSILAQYVNWQFPVAYLEPNTGDLIRHITAGDPMYVIDDRELPYNKLLEKLPVEAKNKFLFYTKEQAAGYIESESVGLSVSWKNFPFKKLGEIRKDIEMMSRITKVNGLIVFDYIDALTYNGAYYIENYHCEFQWKDRIHQFIRESNLEIIKEIEHPEYPFKTCVCRKKGIDHKPKLNLHNKIGLVLHDQEVLAERRQQETEVMRYYKSITSKLNDDLQRIAERDLLLNDLELKRKIDTKKITEQKLKTALNNLDIALTQYDYKHSIVLESILNVSKLTYNLGRKKDSVNLIKRVQRDVDQLDQSSKIAVEYRSWSDFLNNN
jgi:hypothetical protein